MVLYDPDDKATGIRGDDWAPCTRYDCVGLPLHDHVWVPFPPELVTHPFSASHGEGRDIDRFYVDWRAVAYEATTGRRLLPHGQLALDYLDTEATHG